MSDKINTLQEKINNMAEARLEKRLQKVRNLMHQEYADIFNAMFSSTIYIKQNDNRETIHAGVFNTSSYLFQLAKCSLLPKYIQDDTDAFITSVSDLKQRVIDLESSIPAD